MTLDHYSLAAQLSALTSEHRVQSGDIAYGKVRKNRAKTATDALIEDVNREWKER